MSDRFDFFELCWLYLWKPDTFTRDEWELFLRADELKRIDGYRLLLTENVTEFCLYMVDKKQRERASKPKHKTADQNAEIAAWLRELANPKLSDRAAAKRIMKKALAEGMTITEETLRKKIHELKSKK